MGFNDWYHLVRRLRNLRNGAPECTATTGDASVCVQNRHVKHLYGRYVLPFTHTKHNTYNSQHTGQDFEYIVDTNAFQNGQFNLWHTPPTVNLTAGTSMTAGESISIDYYAIHPIEISPSFCTHSSSQFILTNNSPFMPCRSDGSMLI